MPSNRANKIIFQPPSKPPVTGGVRGAVEFDNPILLAAGSEPRYDYREPQWVEEFIKRDAARKLSSADRASITSSRNAIRMSPEEAASNIRTEIDPANLLSLDRALSEASDPDIVKILQNEKSNVMKLVEEADKIRGAQKSTSQESSFMDNVVNLLQSIFNKGN